MKIDILCQQDWRDSWESCIYFESVVDSYKEAIEFIADSCNKLNDYDDIHGFYFSIWFDGERKGEYNKYTKEVKLDTSVAVGLALENLSNHNTFNS